MENVRQRLILVSAGLVSVVVTASQTIISVKAVVMTTGVSFPRFARDRADLSCAKLVKGLLIGRRRYRTSNACILNLVQCLHLSSHLGPYSFELHRQHYREQQNAPNQARATCIRLVHEVRVFCIYEPRAVQEGVFQRGEQGKVPEV